LAHAETAALRAPQADTILAAVRSQAAAVAAAAQTHGKALEATTRKVAALAPQAEAASKCISDSVTQLQASGLAACRQAAESASEIAKEVSTSLKSASRTLEAQRVAFDLADRATEARWLELERGHGDVLKATEAVAAAACSERSALKARAELRSEEERADAAHRKATSELEDHRVQLATALAEQQTMWRSGLSDKPLFVFTEDCIFEDQLSNELPSATAPLPAHVLQDLAMERPNEQALSVEFQASNGQNSEAHKVGVLKEVETTFPFMETPIRARSPSMKAMEASGYPRMALRELNVGGTPAF